MNVETATLAKERRMRAPATGANLPKWQPRPNSLRLRILACLLGIDLLCIGTGFGLAIVVRDVLFGGTNWLFLLLTMLPVYVLAAINGHAYTSENLDDPFRAARRGLRALAFAIIATVFIGFSLGTAGDFPRFVTALGFTASSSLMFVGRYFFVTHFESIVGGNPFNVILIRDRDQPVPPGLFSVMIMADASFDPDARDPLMYDRLAKALQGADRVVVACPPGRREAWASALKGACVQGEIIVPELASLEPLGFGRHGGMPTMVVATGPLKLVDRAIKRSFDIALAGGLVFLIWPVLALVAVAIKLDSRGPVLFRQTRIGRGNEMFEVLKFRSMRDDLADGAGHRSASRDDERITRVGRIIRSSSIDELPQLFNVLKGNMSIVGPRPHALGSRAADKLFWEVDQRYWHRHAAKPGLTGLAQIRGFRGATPMEEDLANRLQADLEYLENWSLWRDVKIILMTFRVLLHHNAF